jgi:hypothetical protein
MPSSAMKKVRITSSERTGDHNVDFGAGRWNDEADGIEVSMVASSSLSSSSSSSLAASVTLEDPESLKETESHDVSAQDSYDDGTEKASSKPHRGGGNKNKKYISILFGLAFCFQVWSLPFNYRFGRLYERAQREVCRTRAANGSHDYHGRTLTPCMTDSEDDCWLGLACMARSTT